MLPKGMLFGRSTVLELIKRMRLLTLGVGRLIRGLSMHDITFLVFVGFGVLLFWTCIVSLLLSPVLWSILMEGKAHSLTSCGLLVLCPKGVGWSVLCETEDVCCWPYSVVLPVKLVTFSGDTSLANPQPRTWVWVVCRMWRWSSCMSSGQGRGWCWRRGVPRYLRPGRPISVSAVPFGPGIDIWRSCRFIGAMMRSLCLLLGGLGRFVPCSIGANHCRLRHIGGRSVVMDLTSRPRESASEPFLNELVRLFNYPPWSARALLAGSLPLRYCAARFCVLSQEVWVDFYLWYWCQSLSTEACSMGKVCAWAHVTASGNLFCPFSLRTSGTFQVSCKFWRFCATRFASRAPTWRLPPLGSGCWFGYRGD